MIISKKNLPVSREKKHEITPDMLLIMSKMERHKYKDVYLCATGVTFDAYSSNPDTNMEVT